jgi:CheY-like chemotaxis protein
LTQTEIATKPLVLVVEDDAMTRMLSICLAEDAGFDTLSVCNADDAVVALENNTKIQIVFTDVEMPGSLCGMQLAALIDRRWPWIGVLVTSGKAGAGNSEFPAGTIFLAKPYCVQKLSTALQRLSASCQAKEQNIH